MILSANVEIWRDGALFHKGHNLVVDDGLDLCMYLIGGAVNDAFGSPHNTAYPSHIALGTSAAAPDPGDSTLVAEIVGTRTSWALLTEHPTIAHALLYEFFITATAAWTVQEIGIFNDVAAGMMLARFITPQFTMQIGDQIQVKWALEVSG